MFSSLTGEQPLQELRSSSPDSPSIRVPARGRDRIMSVYIIVLLLSISRFQAAEKIGDSMEERRVECTRPLLRFWFTRTRVPCQPKEQTACSLRPLPVIAGLTSAESSPSPGLVLPALDDGVRGR